MVEKKKNKTKTLEEKTIKIESKKNNITNNTTITLLVYITIITILTYLDYITKKIHYKKEEFVFNSGISFGLLNNIKGISTIMIIISIIVIILLIFYFLKILYNIQDYEKAYLQLTAITLIITGTLGNLISRIQYGAVIDFIKLEFLRYKINFPQFNLADSYITIGVILYSIYLLFYDKKY